MGQFAEEQATVVLAQCAVEGRVLAVGGQGGGHHAVHGLRVEQGGGGVAGVYPAAVNGQEPSGRYCPSWGARGPSTSKYAASETWKGDGAEGGPGGRIQHGVLQMPELRVGGRRARRRRISPRLRWRWRRPSGGWRRAGRPRRHRIAGQRRGGPGASISRGWPGLFKASSLGRRPASRVVCSSSSGTWAK